MDTETLWILKKLAAGEISAQSADRILRALDLLRKSEKGKSMDSSVAGKQEPFAETRQEIQQTFPIDKGSSLPEDTGMTVQEIEAGVEEAQKVSADFQEEEETAAAQADVSSMKEILSEEEEFAESSEEETSEEVEESGIEEDQLDAHAVPEASVEWETAMAEAAEGEPQETEESALKDMIWPETADEQPLLGDDGTGIIENIPRGTELILETAGNVTIQGWNQNYIRAEGRVELSTVMRAGKNLRIVSEDGITLYIPPAVEDIDIASGSGSINIRSFPNNVVIDSDTGEINISETGGSIEVSSIESDITLENCPGAISLESNFGNIVIKKASNSQTEDVLVVTAVNIETDSGNVALTDVASRMDVKTGDGNVTLERCRGQSISVESDGGEIALRSVTGSLELRNENGRIAVESFSGAINVRSKDADILLRNGSNAEIQIESDGSDVNIEDCCADIRINSGRGNVAISGDNIPTGSMGEVDLRMRTGDAHLRGKTFENVRIVIEEGNAEVNMEKLNADGSGQISVYRGNISVGVLPGFRCQLTAHGLRKNMHIELPVEIVEKDKNRLCGTLNGGGSRMEVIAPNGEIRFHALESLQTESNVEKSAANPQK